MKIFGKLEAVFSEGNRIMLCISKENESYIAHLLPKLQELIDKDVTINITAMGDVLERAKAKARRRESWRVRYLSRE